MSNRIQNTSNISHEGLKDRFGIPDFAFPVRAAGESAAVSFDDEYDPTPESGRRVRFYAVLEELDRAQSELAELL